MDLKYYRYQLIYPIESNKIYKSKSFDKVVTKCWNDYKRLYEGNEKIFSIMNLDTKVEYKFRINKKIDLEGIYE